MDRHAILAGRLTEGMSFNERVLAVCARIPRGKVTTYGHIARALGSRAYRAVGMAMHRNPYAPGVPCHRVVAAGGELGGFATGVATKRRMLAAEGVRFTGDRVDLEVCLYIPQASSLKPLPPAPRTR